MRSLEDFCFSWQDRRRLAAAMRRVQDVRHFRRLQALWLVAQGFCSREAAAILGATQQWVNKWLSRYWQRRRPEDLADGRRTGRPLLAADLSAERLVEELGKQPLECGYAATVWTAPLLAAHLRERYGCKLSERTLRRRLHAAGFRWKRPRYVFAQKEPNRAQKKGLLSAKQGKCRLLRCS